ncbi:MAG TPA: peptidoglycan DD-metalloendopeptidase family protein [Gammaproteobacteria bacterium]
MKSLRIPALVITLAFLAVSCSASRAPAPTASRAVGDAPVPAQYTVSRGDTLYSIAWQYGLDYHEVARWNGIGPPYVIYPGQRLALRAPAAARGSQQPPTSTTERRPAPPPPPAKTVPAPAPQTPASTRRDPPSPVVISNDSASRTVGGIAWRWPTQGRLLSTFASGDPGRKGVDIVGSEGQTVYAAAAGRVVYSGNGLVGYGNLVIIKHDGTYLSAYGHNRELLVREGDTVVAGQLIAKMGRVDNDRAMLHFEIRRNGQPVDPLSLLPKG